MDPALVRAILLLACSVSAGLAVLVVLGALGHGAPSSGSPDPAAGQVRSVPTGPAAEPRQPLARDRGQDPQDRPGAPAHRRADRELAGHRALQHVPWREDGVVIDLVGARGRRAVLEVKAPSIAGARRGYRAFLRRYNDDGHAYLPRLEATGGEDG
ncbi:MAG: hypothetical protein JSU06_10280 [Actinobacteria bacterium]|nr:hypothetical protein [Actinomycetota bacterium]